MKRSIVAHYKKVSKNKLQKPDMNSRKSEYYHPPSATRISPPTEVIDVFEKSNSPIMIAAAAAALTATIIASSIVPESEPVHEKPENGPESDVPESTSPEIILVPESSSPKIISVPETSVLEYFDFLLVLFV